ncbi:MAG: flagellar basal body rod protein FlgB [Thermodesulfobacteriota bacterium]
MSWGLFTDGAMRLLENTLTWRTRHQEVIAGNIANLDTPGYNRKDMDFQQILSSYSQGRLQEVSLEMTKPGHLPGADPGAGLIQETWEPVDLDQEMVRMAENQISYQTSVQMLIKKLDSLRTVINGEGK